MGRRFRIPILDEWLRTAWDVTLYIAAMLSGCVILIALGVIVYRLLAGIWRQQ